MSTVRGFEDKVAFIWSVADLLRGDFKAHEYGQVILPFTVLRRLECALEPNKAAVVARAEELRGKVASAERVLTRVAGHSFYNVSALDLPRILNDPANAAPNLRQYLAGFSPGAQAVLDRYGFEDKIGRLAQADLLYQVVARFAEVDLSETAVPNEAMGYIFEELLRRFSEMSNETAGEHFTPRDVITAMVSILFAPDDAALAGTRPVRTLYDPACGTGGMLTGAQAHLRELNAEALLKVYGQEINAETWAVCRSDMMITGGDPEQIVLGNSFTEDGHCGARFDYLLANPPFGVDWKRYADTVRAEHETRGFDGRFGPGLPRISDGSLLFLLHMLSKLKPVTEDGAGGTRLAIVFSGSPLFAGSAGSGESEIRRWIIENDWLEAIVALPDQMFYNTGISTYFWVLTNRKIADRAGKVALVDAREMAVKMRKSLGNKRHWLAPEAIAEITRLYAEAVSTAGDGASADPRVKVFANETFGYQRITVERPLRRRWELAAEAVEDLVHHKQWAAWLTPPKNDPDPAAYTHRVEADQERLLDALRGLVGQTQATEAAFTKMLKSATAGIDAPAKLAKVIVAEAAVPDPDAPVITDRKGDPLPDSDLRDQENVPLGEDAEGYLKREVLPYAPDAWIDHAKTRIGYEIPLTRHFYVYEPPRPLPEIDAELLATEERIRELLGGLVR